MCLAVKIFFGVSSLMKLPCPKYRASSHTSVVSYGPGVQIFASPCDIAILHYRALNCANIREHFFSFEATKNLISTIFTGNLISNQFCLKRFLSKDVLRKKIAKN